MFLVVAISRSVSLSFFFRNSFFSFDVEREEKKKQDRKDGALSPSRRPRLFSAAPLATPRWRRALFHSSDANEEASDDEAKGCRHRRCRCCCNRDDDIDVDDVDEIDVYENHRPQGHQARADPSSSLPRWQGNKR